MEKVVLAKVGDIEITKEQMISVLKSIPQEHAQSVAGPEGRMRLLDEMVAGELLYLDAKSKDLDQDEEFKQIVEESIKTLLQRYAVNKLFDSIEITDEEVAAFYDENREQFAEPEKASAKHILVPTEEHCAEIKKEIEDGKSFEDAAMEYSTCPSKERGGDLGAFGRGQMVPEFEEAAFSATAGEVVGPVQTQFGYHLIKLEELIPAEVMAMDQVEGQIRQQINQSKQADVYHGKVDELKDVYTVEIKAENLQ